MILESKNLTAAIKDTRSIMAIFDKKSNTTSYHKDLIDYFGCSAEDIHLWDLLSSNGIVSREIAQVIRATALALNASDSVFYNVYSFGAMGYHIMSFTYFEDKIIMLIKLFEEGDLNAETINYDELTKLMTRNHFCREITKQISALGDRNFAVFYFDIIKFKAVNDLFGFDTGDALIVYISERLKNGNLPILCACRVNADHFAFLADVTEKSAEDIVSSLISDMRKYDISFELNFNFGIYSAVSAEESGESMLDKAILAQSDIKGSYAKQVSFYTESLRAAMLSEQEIAGEMNTALAENQFVNYYQPQYNHTTGMLVGAEALVRWIHPEKGMISPARFIPIFEKNGFITKLDYHVFEQSAIFLRHSMDCGFSIVPISVNFSKHDIFAPNFVENLEKIRQKYNIPAKYMRIEITESVLIGSNKSVNEIMSKLHSCGYIVEMDDFGSGYSSLNVLKDLDFDIIKLDMLFLEDKSENSRGGTILSSVINMAKWLNIPVIAEGVETVEQADFLRSIGCDYIQGYLYSKPLPEADYEKLINASHIGALIPQMNLIETIDSTKFWDPASQETLIFSNFVGAASIFSYDRKTHNIDILRVNQKYLRELGMNLSEHDVIHGDPKESLDEINKGIYIATLERAIESGEEQECETWREVRSDCCGREKFFVRSTLTVIGRSDDQVLFYCTIRNITSEKNALNAMLDNEKRFKAASEQVNIYFWEYTIATREMRPCFRCMRDLGLPPLLRNYPDSAIEAGIFPPEVADMYRDWHIQISNGVKELEAVIPLTPNRVPFHVRYTTEFDENGHPVKAYGSAALVVD